MNSSSAAASELELPELVEDPGWEGSAAGSESQRLAITPILTLLWVRRRTMLKISGAGTVLSLLYAFLLPAVYTSTTTLMPPDNTPTNASLTSLAASAGPAGAIGSALLGGKTPGALFVGILGSRTIEQNLVKQLDLVRYYKVPGTDDACRRLSGNTLTTLDAKSGIVTVSVRDRNPVFAARIAQGYAVELDGIVTQNSTSAARRERMFLEGRLKEIKKDLDDSSLALSQFSSKNRTIDIPSQAKAMVEAGLKLDAELTIARSEREALRQAYSDNNVRVRAADARIGELQRQMEQLNGSAHKESSQGHAGASDYPSIVELPALGLTFADLDRKVLVDEALWEALTKQYEMAKVQEAKEIPTVRVLDSANVPEHKSSPVRSVIVILGALSSLLAAFLFVLGKQVWDSIDPRDSRKVLWHEVTRTGAHWMRRGRPVAGTQAG
jgi:uncharacterized protein involved in exopolysaccharide biosynthesis